ncbi:MAG TPA: MBL fold metallo-hydrolase [Acidimicrobiales bacterium]|nr:MBL fold metallo-hydrolase [Acidimicrobiales bacterium]
MSTATPDAPVVTGEPVQISALVRRLTCPNPGMMTGPGTNTYLVGEHDVAVIDPGPDHQQHLDAILAAASGGVRWIIATHTHGDHSPNATALAARTGAEVIGFCAKDGFVPTRTASDGDVVAGAGFRLRAVHTPGHASNHLCWLLEEENLLFSGDHVMSGSTVVISPPDGDMGEYVASLARVKEMRVDAIAPGHGRLISDADAVLEQYIRHRATREESILAALAGMTEGTIDDIVRAVYVDVAAALHPVARYSVWAHLRKLETEGAVVATDRDDIDGRWRTR